MIVTAFFVMLALLFICFVAMVFYIIIDCMSTSARHDKTEKAFVITCNDTGKDFDCEKVCEVPYDILGLD